MKDCEAVGFSGEGRCIEPAETGRLCQTHAALDAEVAEERYRDWWSDEER